MKQLHWLLDILWNGAAASRADSMAHRSREPDVPGTRLTPCQSGRRSNALPKEMNVDEDADHDEEQDPDPEHEYGHTATSPQY